MTVVSCEGSSCTVTIGGSGSMVQIFGATISLQHIRDGRATLLIGHESVTCAEGRSVSAAGLQLRCTRITTDTVQFTATPD
jgi:hypothetical protein